MKKFLPVIALGILLWTNKAFAQQDAIYSQFMYNGLAINPAYAGSAEHLSATALYRKQWINIEGAPETQTLTLDGPIHNKKIGLGLSVINDKIGITSNLNINGIYSYRIKFDKGTLGMGLQTGVNNYIANNLSVKTDIYTTGGGAFSENVNRVIFNFGTGLYFYNEKFFAGISVPHILNQRLDGSASKDVAQAKQYRHYFLTTGYVFDLNEDFKVKPAVLLKFVDGAPLQLDVNSNVWYKERISIGFSYRTNDSFSSLLQVQVAKQLRIGYAYDYITSKLNRYNMGNHELMLRYDLLPKNKKILTPRYF